MPRAFTLLERVELPEGPLELRQSGEHFMITIAGRVLMSSQLNRSEIAVAQLGCEPVRARRAPHVLLGGLGLGFTLRAALDALPSDAHVEVAELNAVVERWCRGPLAPLTSAAVQDPRVRVRIADVMVPVREARARYDAIVIDLYVGPDDRSGARHPLYGLDSLQAVHDALKPGGVYAVWSEEPSRAFEQRLARVGFRVQLTRPQGGGPRNAVYTAIRR